MSLGLYYMSDFSESYHEGWTGAHPLDRMGHSLEDEDDDEEEENSKHVSYRSCSSMTVSNSDKDQRKKKRCFEVLVDGVSGLRLVLHQAMTAPVARTSTLYPYLYRYIDLKKQYFLFYPESQSSLSLTDMMKGSLQESFFGKQIAFNTLITSLFDRHELF